MGSAPRNGLRILHAIHDFLPRHCAGSEIYVAELCREQARRHHITVLCGEYDPSRRHGEVTWRVHDGLPVVELVNNWVCGTFADSYHSPVITDRIEQLLRVVQPDVVHVHNLLNLSFELPALAHARGAPVVATLHDYTLLCPSGGQRIHRAESHLCRDIDPARCARCFPDSPFYAQTSYANVAESTPAPLLTSRAAAVVRRHFPRLALVVQRAASHAVGMAVSESDIAERLVRAREVFEEVDLVVAPSQSIADEFQRFGVSATKLRVSDYGFTALPRSPRAARRGALRIGFVGTLVWHKGVHVLLDAIRQLPPDAYELKIFGSLDVFPDYSAELQARAAGLKVHFMGPFDRDRAAGVYAQFDVLVVPSLWLENSPLVIHEAFMAGVPVVAARIGGSVDLITHGLNGLLYDPGSPGELASALQTLIDDRSRLDAYTEMLPKVKSIAADARELEEAYAQVLGARTAAGQRT